MRVASERVLEEASELGVTIGDVRCGVRLRLRGIAEGRDDITQSEKTAVDRNTLLDTLSGGGSTFELVICQRENTVREGLLTRSEPARSTKWNFEVTVTHSPLPLPSCPPFRAMSGDKNPRELAGRLPLAIADWKLGVPGRPNVGDETRPPGGLEPMTEPGRPMRDGERPPGGTGEDARGGGPLPVYFFWTRVREKMACERED